MTRKWRTLQNGEVSHFYSSTNLILMSTSRRKRWARRVAHTGKMRHAYNVLAGKPAGKRPLGRPRCR
jgi:hypothetical protein